MALKPSGLAIGSLLQRMSRGESDPKLLAEALRQVQDAVWRLEQAAPAAEPTAASFTDRGDPAAVDKTGAGFTQGAWTDWDLSSIVPIGAVGVLLRTSFYCTSGVGQLAFRKNGHANTNKSQSLAPVNTTGAADLVVACDSARVIEYYLLAGTYSSVTATVAGWWK